MFKKLTVIVGLLSCTCWADVDDYSHVELVRDPSKIEGCRSLGIMDEAMAREVHSQANGEPILLGVINGWRYQTYLSGGNVLYLESRALPEGQPYTKEMGGFLRASAHDDEKVVLYPRAYACP
jgi:hypothetical protein